MTQLQITRIDLGDLGLSPRDAHKLRGYIGDRFREQNLLHNHLENGRLRYAYPLVQYKVIAGRPVILGVEAGGQALQRVFFKLDQLHLADRAIPLREKHIQTRREPFGAQAEAIAYRFHTPWLGINQKNLAAYRNGDPRQRGELLERVLVGNLLSMAKTLDCFVAERLQVQARLYPAPVNFKGQRMAAFLGEFSVNFRLPAWLGLGKSCSRGFGTVAPVEERANADIFPDSPPFQS